MTTKPHAQLFDSSLDVDADDTPRSGIRDSAPVVPTRNGRERLAPKAAPVNELTRAPPATLWKTTLWKRVQLAGAGDPVALNTLCAAYRAPLLAETLRLTRNRQRAEDLVQGFLEGFVAKEVVSTADPARGSFRAFLRRCLRNYVYNALEKEHGWAAGGRAEHTDIDEAGLTDGLTPERLYNQSWAWALLDRALMRLGEEETCAGRGARFEALRDRVTHDDALPLRQTAAKLGMNEGAVRVYLYHLRHRHYSILRAEVADTVDRPEDVDQELYELLSAWDEIS